jgi:hypothetical protein
MPTVITPRTLAPLHVRDTTRRDAPYSLTPVRARNVRPLEVAAQHFAAWRRPSHPATLEVQLLNASPVYELELCTPPICRQVYVWAFFVGRDGFPEQTFECSVDFDSAIDSESKSWTQGYEPTLIDAILDVRLADTPAPLPFRYNITISPTSLVEGARICSYGAAALPMSTVAV